MYRKEKNILSTNILKGDDIEKIKLVYNTNPEIIFEKKINIFNPKYQKEKIFNNYKIIADTSNFYFDMTLFLDEKNITVNNNFSKPITIYPYNIPFKQLIPLSYNINECSNCNFYKYNDKKNEWGTILSKKKKNIGLIWSGNFFGPKEPYRSVELKNFQKLLKLDLNFYSFQNEIWDRDKDFFKK